MQREDELTLTEILKESEPNFEWYIGDDFTYSFKVKRSLFNRFKWWLSTKLFLPGTYKFIDKKIMKFECCKNEPSDMISGLPVTDSYKDVLMCNDCHQLWKIQTIKYNYKEE